MKKERKHTILIVDDMPENIDVLGKLLNHSNKVKVATNGAKALEIARAEPQPDLILLDVNMPKMDGYEVCRRLKIDDRTRDILVIFVTTMDETEQEYKGLSLGAVDYIFKPFQPEILLARVNTHLFVAESKRQLKKYNLHLESMVAERTQELAEALDRLKVLDQTKRDFLMVLSHELRTPTHGVLGFADLVINDAKTDENASLIDAYNRARDRLLATIKDIEILTQLQADQDFIETAPVEIQNLLVGINDAVQNFADERGRHIQATVASEVTVNSNYDLLSRSIETLIKAVVLLTKKEGTVVIEEISDETSDNLQLNILGSGLDPTDVSLKTFFKVYSSERPSSYVQELGFSIPVAAILLQAMGGTVSIHRTDPVGIRIQVSLPHYST